MNRRDRPSGFDMTGGDAASTSEPVAPLEVKYCPITGTGLHWIAMQGPVCRVSREWRLVGTRGSVDWLGSGRLHGEGATPPPSHCAFPRRASGVQ